MKPIDCTETETPQNYKPPSGDAGTKGDKLMPNWVYNTLTVTKGDPREVFEFVHSAESIFDFNKIIPMPRELDIESSTKSQLAILCAQLILRKEKCLSSIVRPVLRE